MPRISSATCAPNSRAHHRRPGREGRQGRDRRLVQALRPRRRRPGAEIPERRRRGDHLHRHRPRRHADRRQHRGHGRLAKAISIPVIASGGITNLDDIRRLCEVGDAGIMGAITGRAIYEGTLDFAAAQKLADEIEQIILNRQRRQERQE